MKMTFTVGSAVENIQTMTSVDSWLSSGVSQWKSNFRQEKHTACERRVHMCEYFFWSERDRGCSCCWSQCWHHHGIYRIKGKAVKIINYFKKRIEKRLETKNLKKSNNICGPKKTQIPETIRWNPTTPPFDNRNATTQRSFVLGFDSKA